MFPKGQAFTDKFTDLLCRAWDEAMKLRPDPFFTELAVPPSRLAQVWALLHQDREPALAGLRLRPNAALPENMAVLIDEAGYEDDLRQGRDPRKRIAIVLFQPARP